MAFKRGRYSWLLRPALIIFDLVIINLLSFHFFKFNENGLYFFKINLFNDKHFLFFLYSFVFWLISTYLLKFYRIYRYTSLINILLLLIKQFIVYTILVFAFVGLFRSVSIQASVIIKYLSYTFLIISVVKIFSFYALKTFRFYLRGNTRNIIIIGSGKGVLELKKFFLKKQELGYNIKGVFNDSNDKDVTGKINESFEFLKNNHSIDEIYCAIDELTEKQINDYVKYASLNRFNIKFVPKDNINLFTKRLHIDYYNYWPVLSIQEIALNNDLNNFIKRTFDIVFSLLVIVLVISWLSIVLFILIKLESKGPLFYRHLRNGVNYKEFECYKYRSLNITKEISGSYVTQDDYRVTKIGRFLRKTSIDELPQFVNVLKGEMSVVGPRPHMLSYTEAYSKVVDKYNFIYRHNVKPGITGLAQISGYRGEIETDKDIINRVKYDIVYIENWSLLLDLKIIAQTVLNVLKGEEKAY